MSNYTDQQTEAMVSAYILDPTRETVDKLAEELGRSTKSIIGKLSREGVYRREVYVSKTGESPITKVEIVNNIAESLGVEVAALAGLEKSPKTALRNLAFVAKRRSRCAHSALNPVKQSRHLNP